MLDIPDEAQNMGLDLSVRSSSALWSGPVVCCVAAQCDTLLILEAADVFCLCEWNIYQSPSGNWLFTPPGPVGEAFPEPVHSQSLQLLKDTSAGWLLSNTGVDFRSHTLYFISARVRLV